MIASTSRIALNKEAEMQFPSSLYLHIDSACSYAGLHPITDGAGRHNGRSRVREDGRKREDQLEKALRKTQKESEKIRVEI
eukprot:scaffold275_cov236-Chaetoceros_neogracile.AAC.10